MKLRNKSVPEKEEFSIEKKSYYNVDEMNMMYKIVRDYLYDHQGENALVVSEETGVPREVIMLFVTQGKISLAENSKHMLHECKVCGGLIEKGDICSDCLREKMSNILNPKPEPVKKNMVGYSVRNKGAQVTNYGNRIRRT